MTRSKEEGLTKKERGEYPWGPVSPIVEAIPVEEPPAEIPEEPKPLVRKKRKRIGGY